MRNLIALAGALALTLAPFASAKKYEGVEVPETATAGDKTLELNGTALRTMLFFHVYVAALYAEEPMKDAQKFIDSDQAKQVVMFMKRDLEAEKIANAIRDGFKKNNAEQMPQLEERMKKLISAIPPKVKEGQQIVLTYVPGKGTTISGAGEGVTVEGKDFADALFSVWLGKRPVDEGMKRRMLGVEK